MWVWCFCILTFFSPNHFRHGVASRKLLWFPCNFTFILLLLFPRPLERLLSGYAAGGRLLIVHSVRQRHILSGVREYTCFRKGWALQGEERKITVHVRKLLWVTGIFRGQATGAECVYLQPARCPLKSHPKHSIPSRNQVNVLSSVVKRTSIAEFRSWNLQA